MLSLPKKSCSQGWGSSLPWKENTYESFDTPPDEAKEEGDESEEKGDESEDEEDMPSELKLKFGWPMPDMRDGLPTSYMTKAAILVPLVGTLSKIWLSWVNNVTVHNGATYDWWVNNRPKDQSLITVCNHYSCLDDPLIYGPLPWSTLWSPQRMRWSLAAHDICFTKRFTNWFFSNGKSVPCIRGAGVYQKGIDFCAARLREGNWVHIFPEGRVNDTHDTLRLKWGVGRLVYDCYAGLEKQTAAGAVSKQHLQRMAAAALAAQSNVPQASSSNTCGEKSPLNTVKEYGNKIGSVLRRRKPDSDNVDDKLNPGVVSADSGVGSHDDQSTSSGDVNFSENSDPSNLKNRVEDVSTDNIRHSKLLRHDSNTLESDLARLPCKAPVVLPMYHIGIDTVLPNKYPYIPRTGQRVTIVVGEPVDMGILIAKLEHDKVDRVEARRRITDHIQEVLRELRVKAERLHEENAS